VPIVGRTGITLELGTDKRSSLNAGNIVGVAPREERMWAKLVIERDEGLGCDHLGDECLALAE
jgi:hypothetical protein